MQLFRVARRRKDHDEPFTWVPDLPPAYAIRMHAEQECARRQQLAESLERHFPDSYAPWEYVVQEAVPDWSLTD